jgi:NADP-dependent 3-hydroxy acid dehydrogenase YdfG
VSSTASVRSGCRLSSSTSGILRLEEVDVLLENKNAVIYGGGGSIGGAVARAFAREGARVFLAGRTAAKLEAVAGQIRSAGGAAETAEVDALDEHAVDEHAAAVAVASTSPST